MNSAIDVLHDLRGVKGNINDNEPGFRARVASLCLSFNSAVKDEGFALRYHPDAPYGLFLAFYGALSRLGVNAHMSTGEDGRPKQDIPNCAFGRAAQKFSQDQQLSDRDIELLEAFIQ